MLMIAAPKNKKMRLRSMLGRVSGRWLLWPKGLGQTTMRPTGGRDATNCGVAQKVWHGRVHRLRLFGEGYTPTASIQTSEPSDSRMEDHPSSLHRQILNLTMVGAVDALLDGLPTPDIGTDQPAQSRASTRPHCASHPEREHPPSAQSILVFMIRFSQRWER
jgi:hypothetical protein